MYKDLLNLALAGGGWLIALLTILLGYRERKSAREEERLGKTLDYFTGGSQRRSIGISLLEGVWASNPRFRGVLVPLIANQIVYLLLSSESHDAHNERNLTRLVMIFTAIPAIKELYGDRWGDVCDAISRKYGGETKGIAIPKSTLMFWAKNLGHKLHDS